MLSVGRHPMGKNRKRIYLKEEEFLEEFSDVARVVAGELDCGWRPNNVCDEAEAKNQNHLRSTGEIGQVMFKSAAVYYGPHGLFSSIEIVLESSKRCVKVCVKIVGGKLIAEKTHDRQC
jgi:hypothetical protein